MGFEPTVPREYTAFRVRLVITTSIRLLIHFCRCTMLFLTLQHGTVSAGAWHIFCQRSQLSFLSFSAPTKAILSYLAVKFNVYFLCRAARSFYSRYGESDSVRHDVECCFSYHLYLTVYAQFHIPGSWRHCDLAAFPDDE